jgi:hypothetical protein
VKTPASVLVDIGNLPVQLHSEFGERFYSEEHRDFAKLFEDIFLVTINRAKTFAFVPEIDFNEVENLEFYLNEDMVNTKQDAALFCIAFYDYFISIGRDFDEVKQLKLEIKSNASSENPNTSQIDEKFIFYVSEEKFIQYRNEYDAYFDTWYDNSEMLEESKKSKNMLRFEFMQFIIEKIICSSFFSDNEYYYMSHNK